MTTGCTDLYLNMAKLVLTDDMSRTVHRDTSCAISYCFDCPIISASMVFRVIPAQQVQQNVQANQI